MAESTLSLQRSDLRTVVGDFLGYGTDQANYASAKSSEVDRYIDSGMREFYGAHDWEFLKPIASLTLWNNIAVDSGDTVTGVHSGGSTTLTVTGATPFTASMIGASIVITDTGTFTITSVTSSTVAVVSGNATCSGKTFSMTATGDYRLPDDFGGLIGPLTYPAEEGYEGVVQIVPDHIIRARRQTGQVTGYPQLGAILPVAQSSTATTGQRFNLRLWPTPDGDYVLSFRYRVNADNLTSSNTHPYGGQPYAECLRWFCLYAACVFVGDQRLESVERQRDRLLAAAMQQDSRQRPESLGLMRESHERGARWTRNVTVTLNGTEI